MAIIARSTALAGDHTYISSKDPALDTEAKDFAKRWRLYYDGAGEPPIKEGAGPTVFHLRTLGTVKDRLGLGRAAAEGGGPSLFVFAASLAIKAVDNLIDEDGNGIKVNRVRRGDHTVCDDATINALGFGVAVDIGMRAMRGIQLDPL